MGAMQRRFARGAFNFTDARCRRHVAAGVAKPLAAAEWNWPDAKFLDPGKTDPPLSPAAGDPRRLLHASDPRAGARLTKPRRGGVAGVCCQERQFGEQALRRLEVLGD